MMNPFHQPIIITQGYGPTDFASEPAWGGYKHFHRGIDAVPADPKQWGVGAPIFALIPGTIWHVGAYEDKALHVIVKHDDGSYGCYWHLDSYQVAMGQRVNTDTQIGRMGTTGNSTKPHLHFEWLVAGPWKGLLKMTPINPSAFVEDTDDTPGDSPEQEPVTERDHIIFEIQDIADVIGGDPHYDQTQKDAFNAHVERVLSKGGLEGRALMRDFLKDYGWLSSAEVKTLQDQKAATDAALINATKHQTALQAQMSAMEDEIRQLHVKLEQTEVQPRTDVSIAGITRLRNYLTTFLNKERKGVK